MRERVYGICNKVVQRIFTFQTHKSINNYNKKNQKSESDF